MNDQEYTQIKSKVLKLTGLSLESYKANQMRRRLDGFISRVEPNGVAPFCQTLEKDPEALQRFMDFLTINVSEFFRDAAQFEILKTKVLPDLLKISPTLKIWSAGCSLGAEPYSLAMMLEELSPNQAHRIFATDLDSKSLERAKSGGPYSDVHLEGISVTVRSRYFVKTDEGYMVDPTIRSKVRFKQHNLLNGPFDSGFDLIMCRNVTIYFTDDAKYVLNRGFARSLNDHGVLFIGSTESLLDGEAVGFKRMYASFYQKSTERQVPAARLTPIGNGCRLNFGEAPCEESERDTPARAWH